jgi:mRNA-degrading endonuclease toxin of MazEF toxin-antitoxin module
MIQRNDVLFVELPPPLGGAGREQTGRRPAIAVQDELTPLPTMLVLPVTSQLDARRFPFTLRVEPTTANGLTMPSMSGKVPHRAKQLRSTSCTSASVTFYGARPTVPAANTKAPRQASPTGSRTVCKLTSDPSCKDMPFLKSICQRW